MENLIIGYKGFIIGKDNSGHYNTGLFNSETPKIRLFNHQSDMTFEEFYSSKYWDALCSSTFNVTEVVWYTEEEKKHNKVKELAEGYLKTYTYEEATKIWWDNMTDTNKKIVMSIPNFNPAIFEEITGINVYAHTHTKEAI